MILFFRFSVFLARFRKIGVSRGVQIWSRITKSGFCVVNVQKAYFWRYHRFLDNLKKHVLVGTVGYKVTKGKLW